MYNYAKNTCKSKRFVINEAPLTAEYEVDTMLVAHNPNMGVNYSQAYRRSIRHHSTTVHKHPYHNHCLVDG